MFSFSYFVMFISNVDRFIRLLQQQKRFVSHIVLFLLQKVSLKSSEMLDHTSTQVSNNHEPNLVFFWEPRK